MKKWSVVAGVLFAAAFVALIVVLAGYSALELHRFERSDTRTATFVFAAGQRLAPGVDVTAIGLDATLRRLNYVETRTMPTMPGQFHRRPGAWDLYVRGPENADGRRQPARVTLDVRGQRITRVLRDGSDVEGVALEPEVLTSIAEHPGEDVRPVSLADVPLGLIQAVVAAEDRRYFEHGGVDLRGLMRAAWANMRAGRVRQGGSTITQQVVKNRLLSPRRTFLRKVDEAWLAALVEWRYPKERILESYLNEVYLGQRGGLAVRGVGAAARAYFGKELHQLTLGEEALIAGMIRAPNTYSPAVDLAHAVERRDVVLGQMRDLGMIRDADWRAALHERVHLAASAPNPSFAPYFGDYVRQELEQRFGRGVGERRDTEVQTTLDLTLQRMADTAVARGLDRLETRFRRLRRSKPAERLQAVLVAVDPGTGEVKALVGGRDYRTSQFNRALYAHRQPGSAFKPFVYAAALAARGGKPAFTAASMVDDSPITLTVDGRPWAPRNYNDRYEGRVSVRRALQDSLNAATVRVAETVGLPAVVDNARAFGIQSPLQPVPAMALGAYEVTPIELARAYLPFAHGGVRPVMNALRGVRTRDGAALSPAHPDHATAVVSPAEAYVVTSLLQGVVASGTGASVRSLGVTGDVAGKTGTTNDARDAWFVGYTPTLLALVWVGFDNGDAHGLTGAEAALPIWADFMKQALTAYPAPPFTPPPGVTFAQVDATNGKLANQYCPVVVREVFLTGTEPPLCDEHDGGAVNRLFDWWRRFRDWLGR